MNNLDLVVDLVRKYPKGPLGKYKKADYNTRYRHSDVYDRSICGYTLFDSAGSAFPKTFGYDPVSLWDLVKGSRSSSICEDLVRSAFPNEQLTWTSVTRRARRLQDRTGEAISYLKKHGSKGVWSACWGYGTDTIYIHAKGLEDAQAIASVLAGFFGASMSDTCHLSYHNTGDASVAKKLNENTAHKMVTDAEQSLRWSQERLDKSKKALEKSEKLAALLRTVCSISEEASNAFH